MSHSHIEQIKSRILPSTLIAKYRQLKNKGNGEFVGLCPFHEETTPSFTVSDRKGFYHCFGCGANGDIFTFLVNHKGLSYRQALEQLAAEAQVELPQSYKEEQSKLEKLTPLFKLFEKAAQFYHQQLYGREGAVALKYLKDRGLNDDTIAEFNLGYAPQSDLLLLKYLRSQFDEETVLSSKLFLQGKGVYSPFKGRVMFPICNRQGRVIAFGGRALKEGEAAKYINSMENPIFHKGSVLYNMHRATGHGFKANSVIVVEGYIDVISLAHAGINNAVAPLGANVRVEQVMQLWSVASEPIICLDSDRAGQAAAHRLSHAVLPHLTAGKSLKFCYLRGAKDPDEMIRKNGVLAMKKALDSAIPLVDVIFNHELQQEEGNTPEKRLNLQEKLSNLASLIKNPSLSKLYQQFFKNKLYEYFAPKFSNKKAVAKAHNDNQFSSDILSLMAIEEPEIISILGGCVLSPPLLNDEELYEILVSCDIDSPVLSQVRDFLVAISDDIDTMRCCSLEDEVSARFGVVFDKRRLDPALWAADKSLSEAKNHTLRAAKLHNLRRLMMQIKEVELLLKQNEDMQLFDRLVHLKQQESLLQEEIS